MYNNDYKKMTAKDFKKIIDDAELYFDCWGYEGILNILAIFEDQQSKEELEKGHTAYAASLKRISDKIYDALCARGWYDRERRSESK